MCVYVCVSTYTYVYICICAYICVYKHIHTHIYCIYMHACMCVCCYCCFVGLWEPKHFCPEYSLAARLGRILQGDQPSWSAKKDFWNVGLP